MDELQGAERLERPKVLLPVVLFIATIITTVVAGALYQGDILNAPSTL